MTPHSFSLQNSEISALYQTLCAMNYEQGKPPAYALWRLSGDGCVVIAYQSGKLVVQGKGSNAFVSNILTPLCPARSANPVASKNITDSPVFTRAMVGMDESGKGDFFGPLVTAAVYVDETTAQPLLDCGVKDCKSISDAKLLQMADKVLRILSTENYEVVILGNEAYNRMYTQIPNVNQVLAWAHARALENLLTKKPLITHALVDQFSVSNAMVRALRPLSRKIQFTQRTKAESELSVATASVLARALFIRRLNALEKVAGVPLPKGAGHHVVSVARSLWKKHPDPQFFAQFSKLHFKTFTEISDDGTFRLTNP